MSTTPAERAANPRCPVCGHRLRPDGTGDWICSARGGCGAEWHAETLED